MCPALLHWLNMHISMTLDTLSVLCLCVVSVLSPVSLFFRGSSQIASAGLWLKPQTWWNWLPYLPTPPLCTMYGKNTCCTNHEGYLTRLELWGAHLLSTLMIKHLQETWPSWLKEDTSNWQSKISVTSTLEMLYSSGVNETSLQLKRKKRSDTWSTKIM